MSEIIRGPQQFAEFAPDQEPIVGNLELKPERNRRMEQLIVDLVAEKTNGDKRLESEVKQLLETVPLDEGNSFGGLADRTLPTSQHGRTMLEHLAERAISEKDPDRLETAIERLVNDVRRGLN